MAGRRKRVAIDYDRVRKDQIKSETGTDLLKLKEGHTLLYICPPVHDSEPVPYAEGKMGFAFGPDKKSVVNLVGLDECEPVLAALKKMNMTFEEAEDGWDRAEELVEKYGSPKRQGHRNRWWFNVVVMGHRVSARKDWDEPDPKVVIFPCGKMIFDGITDLFFEEGDLTDYDQAIFVRIKRTGTGLDTEYKVDFDSESLKNKGVELDDDMIDMLEKALQPGKPNDLHAHIAGMCKTAGDLEDIWDGKKPSSDSDDDNDKKRKPSVTSRSASSRRRGRKKVEEPEEPEDDDDDEKEAEEEAKPKRTRRSRKKVEEKVEESDDDDDDDDGDEEAEPEAKPKRTRRSRKKAEEKVEEPEDEPEDDDEEPEPEPEAKPKRTRRSRKKVEEPDDDGKEESDADALDAAMAKRGGRRSRRKT